ncbi:hypothetical protein K432DRAFT_316169, partial [Lepidopterella palustris CBS 459.81]
FYTLIKTLFNTLKVYVFSNKSLKNLTLDSKYKGGGIIFSKAMCKFKYLYGKRQAYTNLINNWWKLYGVREEHRIFLIIINKIYRQ